MNCDTIGSMLNGNILGGFVCVSHVWYRIPIAVAVVRNLIKVCYPLTHGAGKVATITLP